MQNINNFAGGGTTSGIVRWEPILYKVIEGYLESNSVLRSLCYIHRISNTLTANIPRSESSGTAVEIVEGMEIPSARQVIGTVDIKVSANGTAIQMSDEAKMLDWYGDLAERELTEAAKRMLRKENTDIMNTLVAGASTSVESADVGVLGIDDLLDCKTYMRKAFLNPDVVYVNPDEYAGFVKLEEFRDFSQSGTTLPLREGVIGGRIVGLNILEIPEIPSGTAIMEDTSKNSLWLVLLQDLQSEAFRIPDERTDKVQMWTYEKPAVLRPEALRKMTVKVAEP
jgi:HK97 family phage major capsid protein